MPALDVTVWDRAGRPLGRVDPSGNVIDAAGHLAGNVDGTILARDGWILGYVHGSDVYYQGNPSRPLLVGRVLGTSLFKVFGDGRQEPCGTLSAADPCAGGAAILFLVARR